MALTALVILLVACTGTAIPSQRVVTSTPLPVQPSLTPEPILPSPTLSPTPSPTPTATPWPTPDPNAMLGTAEAGQAAVAAALGGAELTCLRYEDMDADGQPEWLALGHQGDASNARLSAFILDEAAVYPLASAQPRPGAPDVGFGQYPTCEVEIRDVNVDGTPEVAIFGHADGNLTLLHLFAWDGETYRRLGFFSGDAGVRFVDADGDAEEEIWEGHRVAGAPSLAWYIVHTWKDNTYGWTSEHHGWYFSDRPQSYPTHRPEYAVISYYLALNDRDLPGAYDLLLAQERPVYEEWVVGYATTARVSAGSVHTIPAATGETRARVAAMITAWDNERGVIVGRLWNVEWDTVLTDAGWRLTTVTAEQLEEWTVSYWP
ncbi:MAG: hypothetical protein ACP5HG_10325 [Anaerolineae bacterium]